MRGGTPDVSTAARAAANRSLVARSGHAHGHRGRWSDSSSGRWRPRRGCGWSSSSRLAEAEAKRRRLVADGRARGRDAAPRGADRGARAGRAPARARSRTEVQGRRVADREDRGARQPARGGARREARRARRGASRASPTARRTPGSCRRSSRRAKDEALKELERISGLTLGEARQLLLERSEDLIRHELARSVRQLEEEARTDARRRARALVADALQRVAASHTAETTVTVVELASDDMKGRIIGREGRNIRALEHLTGVDFIIDDTPHAVVLSSFDGIRREVARMTLEKLIEDGRIHPARIEEMYYQSKAELEEHVRQAGEQAVFEANCGEFHEELVKILGRLRYRTSYGQNVLKHTLEVVHLAGIMAAELGASVKTAKRAALLHDIGKAMTHEIEGSHALVSPQLARRYGESQGVVHAIEAHHYEVQPQTVEAVLLIAADAISASRPGARGEPRALHQAARGARGDRDREAGRREGLRAAGRPGDPRDGRADRGRRRRRRCCSRTRSRARSRTSSSTRGRSR